MDKLPSKPHLTLCTIGNWSCIVGSHSRAIFPSSPLLPLNCYANLLVLSIIIEIPILPLVCLFTVSTGTSNGNSNNNNNNKPAKVSSSWVHSDNADATYFMLQMHPDLADPTEQLGMEIEQDDNETVTDIRQRFGVEKLAKMQINLTDMDELDLRCGGLVRRTNMSYMNSGAVKCLMQRCTFTLNAPEICPPDYKETDDTIFWIYFLLR